MNSMSTSPPGACFRSQAPSPPFSAAIMPRISITSARAFSASRFRDSALPITQSIFDRMRLSPAIDRARVSAMCSQVQASFA